MRCFYHAAKDAVGLCSECGKAACRDCIEDVGGALLCKACLDRARTRAAAKEEEARREQIAEQTFASERAAKHIRRSFILGSLAGAFFLLVSFAGHADAKAQLPFPWFIAVPGAAYTWWSIYWGVVWFWPKWRRFVGKVRRGLSGWFIIARPAAWFMILFFYLLFYLTVPVTIAIYYGVFGGAIREYRKAKRLVKGGAAAAVSA